MTTSHPFPQEGPRGICCPKDPRTPKIYCPSIPKRELEALARCLLPAIQEYFESEEGQREFAEWEAQQEQ